MNLVNQPVSAGAINLLCIWLVVRITDFTANKNEFLRKLLDAYKKFDYTTRNRISLSIIRGVHSNRIKPIPFRLIERKGVLQISPKETATQMTMIDAMMFEKLTEKDFLDRKNSKQIKEIIERSNNIPEWVASFILAQKDNKYQQRIIKRFIAVAFYCNSMGNYNSLQAILQGFNLGVISRLSHIWKFNEQDDLMRKSLITIMGPKDNYRKYRESLAERVEKDVPVIPYLGLHLKDFAMIEEGNIDILDKTVNTQKLQLLVENIQKIKELGQVKYTFKTNEILKSLISLKRWSVEKLEAASTALKPRPRNGSSVMEDDVSSNVTVSFNESSDSGGLVEIEESSN